MEILTNPKDMIEVLSEHWSRRTIPFAHFHTIRCHTSMFSSIRGKETMDLINIYMEMWYIYERTCETSIFQTSKSEIKVIWKQV